MNEKSIYEKIPFEDVLFPIRVNFNSTLDPRAKFSDMQTWHEQMELLFFKSDGATVHCAGESYQALAGELYLINPFEIHFVSYSFGAPVYDCIMIDPALYRDVLGGACEIKYFDSIADRQVCFENHIGKDEQAVGFAARLTAEYESKDFAYELAVKRELFGLFVYLFRNRIKDVVPRDRLMDNIKRCERLRPAFALFNERFSEPISLQDMARSCYMNASHFCRLFKATTGKTPVSYLTEMRLNEAERLLRKTDRPVGQVASEVGISDMCYFSRRFKERFHCTPTQIRSQAAREYQTQNAVPGSR